MTAIVLLSSVRFTTVFIMKHCLRIRGDLHSDANCYSIVQSCVPIPFQVFPTSSQHTREKTKSADRHIGEEGVAKFLSTGAPLPEGDIKVGRWHAPGSLKGVIIVETDNVKGLYEVRLKGI